MNITLFQHISQVKWLLLQALLSLSRHLCTPAHHQSAQEFNPSAPSFVEQFGLMYSSVVFYPCKSLTKKPLVDTEGHSSRCRWRLHSWCTEEFVSGLLGMLYDTIA